MAASWLLPSLVAAQPRELQRIGDELVSLGVAVDTLVQQYGGDGFLELGRSFSARLSDAEVLFLLGEYNRASLLLLDIVGPGDHLKEPLYGKALFYLAESLYQIGNTISAREHFRVLVRRGDPEYMQDAVRRLIEICDQLHQSATAEAYVNVLRQRGPLAPEIAYIYAKSLLRRDGAEAAAMAENVPPEHRLFGKAQYLEAVGRLKQGDTQGSLDIFSALMTIADTYEDAAYLRNLAAMNKGRLLLEQGDLTGVLDAYQHVDRHSAVFNESLFEVTWAFVHAAEAAGSDKERIDELSKAARTLEILLLSEPDGPVVPEAQLLLGNILLRLNRLDDADIAFRQVLEHYGPLRDRLTVMADRIADPGHYYDEVVARTAAGEEPLPPEAVQWATELDGLRRAMALARDLDRAEAWLQESQRAVDKLRTALEAGDRNLLFPGLVDANREVTATGNSLDALRKRLQATEREVVAPALPAPVRAELDEVLAERTKLELVLLKLPLQADAYVRADEERLRERYKATLEREQRLLVLARRDLDAAARAWLHQIKKRRATIERLSAKLARLRDHFARLGEKKATAIRAELAHVQARLLGFEQAIAKERDQARHLAGQIAAESIRQVRETFSALVLKADVGAVDVAWARMQERNHEISRCVHEHQRELKILDAEFSEVLGEP